MSNKNLAYGNFGRLAEQYNKNRPEYPERVISIIYDSIRTLHPVILDLGCGTGIATRQLAKRKESLVVGCDADAEMLRVAAMHLTKNISYKKGNAEKLPFESSKFDAVVSFIAFHWFMNKKAIREIGRVMKPDGKLIIVQPRYAPFQKDFRLILERELGKKISKNYKLSQEMIPFLEVNGFQCKLKRVKADAKYTLNQYISLLKSYSLWNYVPQSRRKKIEAHLNQHFKKKLRKGYIKNIRDVEVIVSERKSKEFIALQGNNPDITSL